MKAILRFTLLLAALAFGAGFSRATDLIHDESWCNLNTPTRLTADTVNHLYYVTSPMDNKIVVFDAAGAEVSQVAVAGHPGAIALTNNGTLLVSVGRSVKEIAVDGAVLTTIGLVENYFVEPHAVLQVPDGRFYVADNDDYIKVFDSAGTPLFTFGQNGSFAGRFSEPVALAYNPLTNELVVSDQNNHRIQVFSLEGTYLRAWGNTGNGIYSPSSYYRPFGLKTLADGTIWSYDAFLDLLQVYDAQGILSISAPVNSLEIRGGVDLAIDGSTVLITSPSTGCLWKYHLQAGMNNVAVPPLELTIQWTPGGIHLRWNELPNTTSYVVQRSRTGDFSEFVLEVIAVVSTLSYLDTSILETDKSFFYRIVADRDGGSFQGPPELRPHAEGHLDQEHDPPHNFEYGVDCNRCHIFPYDYPDPLPEWWISDHLCKSCHVETGFAKAVRTHLGPDTIQCRICHSPHFHQPQFERYFINNVNPVGGSANMLFNNATDFLHGPPNYDGICEICHTQTSYHRNDASGDHTHNAGTNCVECHTHESGFMPVGGGGACNACHGAPPMTGAHLAHFGGTVEQASYGTVQNLSDSATYIFSCGTCHPSSSSSYHRNGTVDIELYDPGAPAGSLKSLNPPTAMYAGGSCSNVYCHSATDWTSGNVSYPLMDGGRPILDANGNLTYAPYTVNTTRTYTQMDWNGTALDCNGCHRNGPQTAYPAVQGGVGQSHGWIDDWGYEDLHAYNMASDPLTCRVCHYGTVTAQQTWTRDSWDITTYNDVEIANHSRHVNGSMDVMFDPINQVTVQGETFSLAATTYDPAARTCSSAPCHLAQTTPEWGKPYRWWDTAECDQCHNMTGWFGQRATLETQHVPLEGRSCSECHDSHPHR